MRISNTTDILKLRKGQEYFLTFFFITSILAIFNTGCSLYKEKIIETDIRVSKYYDEARKNLRKRKYDKAESLWKEAILIDPMNPDLHFSLGELYLTIEDYEMAIYEYKTTLSIDPDYFDATASLWAAQLEKENNSSEIKNQVTKEVNKLLIPPFPPNNKRYLIRMLAAYQGLRHLKRDKEAIDLIDRIMHIGTKENIVSALASEFSEDIIGEGNSDKRIKLAERYLKLFPKDVNTRNLVYMIMLGTSATDLKDNNRLMKYSEWWLSEDNDNRIANYKIGYWYTEQGIELDWAIRYLQKALILIDTPDPDQPLNQNDDDWIEALRINKGHYLDTLGWAFYKRGEYKKAEESYIKAEEILDFDERLYYHRGLLYEKNGEREKAIVAYLRSVKAGNTIEETEISLNRMVSEKGNKTDSNELEPQISDQNINRYFSEKEGIATFTDVTKESGLSEVKAQRIAWGDYNNDGYEDILFDGHFLYRNNKDGTFTDVTKESVISNDSAGNGGVWADFDNDGFLDFYMMTKGTNNSYGKFFRNLGNGSFADLTSTTDYGQQQGVAPTFSYWNEGAGWGDYDNDGFVDLYVANYEKRNSIGLGICSPDILWKNHDGHNFTNETKLLTNRNKENFCGRGVNWGDFNNDGFSDIFVSNYRLDPNYLWVNMNGKEFVNMAEDKGVEGDEVEGYYGHTIGSEWGDYNNDGNLDLFSANLAHPRYLGQSNKGMLLENTGAPDYKFINKFKESGIRYEESHSDPSFGDYDNDGDLDLFITSVYGNSFLYRNEGNGKFIDITWLAGVRVRNGWGNAYADFDNDGDIDLLVATRNGVRLFKNDGNGNSYLHVRPIGTKSNRSGIGTRVKVTSGGTVQIREVEGGKGTGTQHSLPVEFGFGKYNGNVEVEIRFPSGIVKMLESVRLNQSISVFEE